MPLPAFTVVGNTLDATILDGNFEILRQYLQQQIVAGDISVAQIDRYISRQFISGKIAAAEVRSYPLEDNQNSELSGPKADREETYRDLYLNARNLSQQVHTMELLGRPGPSFYWQFQEDGIVYGNAPDPQRYDPGYCYSLWKTVPHCSLKVYVPHPCLVKMHARAYFLACMSGAGESTFQNSAFGWQNLLKTYGKDITMRLGLFVDTNPNLHSDEFSNSNPNILDPVSGAQATRCSWQEVSSKTIGVNLWNREDITGSVVLKGGRWYNFSLKYRGSGSLGYRAGGIDPFIDEVFEYAGAALPNFNGSDQQTVAIPPFDITYLSKNLFLEFIYGYNTIVSDTSLIGTAP